MVTAEGLLKEGCEEGITKCYKLYAKPAMASLKAAYTWFQWLKFSRYEAFQRKFL